MSRRFLLSLWLLISVLGLADLSARAVAPPPLSRLVAAVERAETAELARLDAAIAASVDRTEILALQNSAAYVKLAGRLALCEGLLSRTEDIDEKARLLDAAAALRGRLERHARTLPAEFAYDPLVLLEQEVKPCAE
jgi:hypothetical protein